jgi:hypothetical protein
MVGIAGLAITDSGLTSHTAVAGILSAGSKADGRDQRKGQEWETNPIELTCFISATYRTDGRNKPKGDMSNVFSNLERN